MKILLLACLSFWNILAYSQIAMDGGFAHSMQLSENYSSVEVNVTNTTDQELTFFWDIAESDGTPVQWQFKVCDMNTCYDWDVSQPCEVPAILAANSSYKFIVYLKHEGISGSHEVKLRTLQNCGDPSSVLANTPISWEVKGVTSTIDNLEDSSIIIYPNPTFDRFQLRNDKLIAAISIFNIVGKNVISEKHRPGSFHDISSLQKGIYLVRLMDKNNEILKVIRLTRR